MHSARNQIRWAAAGSFLLIGAVWAGAIYRATPTYGGPDPGQLEILAQRLGSQTDNVVSELPDPPVVAAPRRVVTPPAAPRRAVTAVTPRSHLTAPVLPPAGPVAHTPPPAPAPAPARVKPAESPVKSLALMGLTHRDQEDTAWLVDISNMSRETAEVGERAFGFTVKEIGAESVLLARNGEEYELRLGEKSIPVPAGSQSIASVDDASGFGDPTAFGNGRTGRRGRGQGGFGRGGFGRAGFGGQGRNSYRSQSGGGRGNFSASTSAPGLGGSSRYSGNSGYSGNRGNRSGGTASGFRSSTGFGGGTGGGRSFGGANRSGGSASMTSQFAAGTGGSTSNPQTARRRGSRLTGDTPALPSPQIIANPQTQRRTGSNSGTAFGQASATGYGASRTGGTRLGTSGSSFQRR